ENYLNYIASTSNWGVDANGNWSASANWLGGAPSAVDMLAGFNDTVRGAAFSGPRIVTVDSPQTVGVINFDSATSFTINGSATITLDDSSGATAINVLAGSHTISAPVNLADNTAFVVLPASSTLQLSNLQPSNVNLSK